MVITFHHFKQGEPMHEQESLHKKYIVGLFILLKFHSYPPQKLAEELSQVWLKNHSDFKTNR